jgi:DNA-binding CsgD family transcriptional regulator
MHDFEDYVEKANAAANEEELFRIYLAAVARHGLDRAMFCIATHHRDIDVTPGIGVMHNYPDDWMRHYFAERFDRIDPVVIYGLSQQTCYRWDVIPQRMLLKKRQLDCLDLGREAGLHHGVCTPLRGPRNQLAGLSLASSLKTDGFDGNTDLITAYSHHFYVAWRRLRLERTGAERVTPELSEKEKDVLSWIAVGKTDDEIGMLMGCSPHTVDFHVRRIFAKLGVSNRILAVTTAMAYGLINP